MNLRDAAPVRPLAALTAAVLVGHLLALRGAPPSFIPAPQAPGRALATRTITPPAAQPAAPVAVPTLALTPAEVAAAVPAAATRPAPVSRPPVRPEPEPPAPVPAPAPAPQPVPAQQDITPAPVAAAPALAPGPAAPRLREAGGTASTYRVPGSAQLRYDVTGESKKQTYNARAALVWNHNGQQYNATLEVSAFLVGSRVRSSAGRITADGLQPERFSDKARSEQAAHFNRDKGEVTFSANTPSAPLLAGAQDQLSVILQLAAMLAGDPLKYPAATTITVQTISAREADTWLFTVEGAETLELPGGQVAAIKLTRNPRREFDQKVELWLAPSMDYMPVRLRLTQANGDFVDQRWRSTDTP